VIWALCANGATANNFKKPGAAAMVRVSSQMPMALAIHPSTVP
jgi:hypothetical protein